MGGNSMFFSSSCSGKVHLSRVHQDVHARNLGSVVWCKLLHQPEKMNNAKYDETGFNASGKNTRTSLKRLPASFTNLRQCCLDIIFFNTHFQFPVSQSHCHILFKIE